MFEEFEPQGLALLAMTGESSGVIERFMEDTPMPYPVGCGDKSARAYEVGGIPHAFLIDHKGEVVWHGHPGGGNWVGMLPKLLGQAQDAGPTWDPGERPETLAKAVEFACAGRMKDAIKAAERAKGDDEVAATTFLADLGACVERRLERAKALGEEGCYFEATEYLMMQAGAFKGTPHAEKFEALRTEWIRDKQIKALIALDKKRVQADDDAREGEADKAAKSLEKLLREVEGTTLEGSVEAALARAKASR
ncbi:MAG: redoxin domain-containing protein [Planctomycetes bacterium]|nr:redoxin domain-containing protein [Planctomycetota bacterium]MBL7008970.1 redoxin domain-containing protein [Planctomycetota bacterium]